MVSKASNRLATTVAALALAVALVGNATTLYVAEKADSVACASSQDSRDALREIFKRGKRAVNDSKTASQAQKDAAIKFYNQLLKDYPPIECE